MVKHNTTTDESILALLQRGTEMHAQHGTDVRCPTCNAGTGKFCRDATGTRVLHTARLALSNEHEHIWYQVGTTNAEGIVIGTQLVCDCGATR